MEQDVDLWRQHSGWREIQKVDMAFKKTRSDKTTKIF